MKEIIWHPCDFCGQSWPFPFPSGSPDREWTCHVCVQAQWAELERAKAARGEAP